jgi:hypothetical protein
VRSLTKGGNCRYRPSAVLDDWRLCGVETVTGRTSAFLLTFGVDGPNEKHSHPMIMVCRHIPGAARRLLKALVDICDSPGSLKKTRRPVIARIEEK